MENMVTLCAQHHRVVEARLLDTLMLKHPELTKQVLADIYAEVLKPIPLEPLEPLHLPPAA